MISLDIEGPSKSAMLVISLKGDGTILTGGTCHYAPITKPHRMYVELYYAVLISCSPCALP